jgi:hypothetical protein
MAVLMIKVPANRTGYVDGDIYRFGQLSEIPDTLPRRNLPLWKSIVLDGAEPPSFIWRDPRSPVFE